MLQPIDGSYLTGAYFLTTTAVALVLSLIAAYKMDERRP
jgi:hypothetical protein